MKFLKPARIGDTVTTIVNVIEKNNDKRIMKLSTVCINQYSEAILTGTALIQVMQLD
jgi:acyl dehydratase